MQPGPYAPPPPPPVAGGQVHPSIWWFGVAGVAIAGGIAGAIAWWVIGVVSMTNKVDDYARIRVPGSGLVVIDDTEGYSVYHEYDDASDDSFLTVPAVTITSPSGASVDLASYSGNVTYTTGNHEGVGIYTFEATETGSYEVTVTGTAGESGTQIAIGRGLGRGLVTSIVGGLVVGFIGVVGGGALAIVTGVRRGRNRRHPAGQWRPPPSPQGGGWGAPPGWGGPGGAYPQPEPPAPGPPAGRQGPPSSQGPPPGLARLAAIVHEKSVGGGVASRVGV